MRSSPEPLPLPVTPLPSVSDDDILMVIDRWRRDGEPVALATVTETWGSSPRPVGSQMAMAGSGGIAGSVSGGCIESAVAEAAGEVLRNGIPRLLEYGVSNERAWEVGLACGGRVKVFVERVE
jgi:xanthine/CO dehydrogenase XdhC/CoxF family maturation factor